MKILVTGAAGFTGRFFLDAAISAGHKVLTLKADLTDKKALFYELSSLDAPEAVVHLAAISFVGHSHDHAFYEVNVIGTSNLLDGLASLPVRPTKVLLASSANVYGNCTTSPINERHPVAPVNHYAMSKLAMEYLARTYLDRLPILISRPFNYTGPGQDPNFLIPKLVNHFAKRAHFIELGNLQVEREFNDVRMVCNAYLELLAKGAPSETYNICTGQTYSLQHVIELLSEMTNHNMDIRVNSALVRVNEVHRLCGSPNKLIACTNNLQQYHLNETLSWMLKDITLA